MNHGKHGKEGRDEPRKPRKEEERLNTERRGEMNHGNHGKKKRGAFGSSHKRTHLNQQVALKQKNPCVPVFGGLYIDRP
jgi:hypothetical protein